MSEKMKQLFEKLAQNPELKAELEKNPPKSVEDVIAVAAKLGVELKKEELEDKELSLDNADQVEGGYFAAVFGWFFREAGNDAGFRDGQLGCCRANGIVAMKPRPNEQGGICLLANEVTHW